MIEKVENNFFETIFNSSSLVALETTLFVVTGVLVQIVAHLAIGYFNLYGMSIGQTAPYIIALSSRFIQWAGYAAIVSGTICFWLYVRKILIGKDHH